MQSYYSVIKNNNVTSGDVKVVATTYENSRKIINPNEEVNCLKEDNEIQSETLASEILEEARRESEEILKRSYEKAKQIEKETYEKAYNQGLENGFNDGREEAFNKIIPVANEEANNIKAEATNMLVNCHNEYNDYLREKEADIIKLSLEIAEKILKKEVELDGTISNIIKDTIEAWRDSESIIIKVNPQNYNEVRNNLDRWKYNYAMQGEIFLIEDNSIEIGNALLEKSSGKSIVGIDIGLEKIKKELLG